MQYEDVFLNLTLLERAAVFFKAAERLDPGAVSLFHEVCRETDDIERAFLEAALSNEITLILEELVDKANNNKQLDLFE